MTTRHFCPNCQHPLNSRELRMKFCENCREDFQEVGADFDPCNECNDPDECSDSGCFSEKLGI